MSIEESAAAHQGVAGRIDADGIHEVFERDDGAGALRHAHRLAVLQQVDLLADQDLEVDVGHVAERRRHRHQALHVAVVVGAEQDDVALEAALALVEVVGEVAGDVGGLAVLLDDHAVFVVAELGGAQPGRAVGLEDVAERAQTVDGAFDRTRLVQRVLVREDVEVDAEVVEARLDLAEHQVHAELAEHLLRLVARQIAQRGRSARIVGLDPRRDLEDVGAAVPVLRRRLAQVRGDQAAGEPVDLDAVIVEVVLARDDAALRLEDARQASRRRRPSAFRRCAAGPVGFADTNSTLMGTPP